MRLTESGVSADFSGKWSVERRLFRPIGRALLPTKWATVPQ
jgi:hypothetical protein